MVRYSSRPCREVLHSCFLFPRPVALCGHACRHRAFRLNWLLCAGKVVAAIYESRAVDGGLDRGQVVATRPCAIHPTAGISFSSSCPFMLRRVDHPPDRSQVLRVSHALGCRWVAATVGLPLVRRRPPETARLVSTSREPTPSKESITPRLPANHDRKRSRAIMQWAI